MQLLVRIMWITICAHLMGRLDQWIISIFEIIKQTKIIHKVWFPEQNLKKGKAGAVLLVVRILRITIIMCKFNGTPPHFAHPSPSPSQLHLIGSGHSTEYFKHCVLHRCSLFLIYYFITISISITFSRSVSACLCLFLCLCLCVCVCLSLSLFLPLSLSLCVFVSVSVSVCVSLSFSASVSVSFSVCLSLCLCLYLSLSLPLSLCLFLCLSVCLSVSVSVCLSVSVSVSLSLSLSKRWKIRWQHSFKHWTLQQRNKQHHHRQPKANKYPTSQNFTVHLLFKCCFVAWKRGLPRKFACSVLS